jgi:hypothetical protein
MAQSRNASVLGTVTDASGAVVPGAKVTVTNINTGEVSTAIAGAAGEYTVVNLLYGSYKVKAELQGFKAAEQAGLTLEIGQQLKIDLVLVPGVITQTVEVTGAPALLSTQSATVVDTISSKQVLDLPLNGRGFLQLATLGAGSVSPRSTTGPGYQAGSAIAVNGNGADFNSFTLDGVSNNSPITNAQAFNPTIDAIQEFKILSNSSSAEYGRAAAQIVVATKSGTNAFHGSAYEFLRNDKLDARNFFDRSTSPIPPLRQNTYGGTIGGPVRKDKSFFFFSYDGLKTRNAGTRYGRIPPAAWLAGNFSSLLPGTQLTDGFGNPVPGNIILPASIHPTAKALFALYPQPNLSGDPAGNNYTRVTNGTNDNYQYTARYDHRFNDSNQIFGRFSRNKGTGSTTGLFPIGIGGQNFWFGAVNTGISYTHIFSPTTTNTLLVGYTYNNPARQPEGYKHDFGAAVAPPVGADEKRMPFLSFGISGYSGIGFGDRWVTFPDYDYNAKDIFTWVSGKHTVKVGMEYHQWQDDLAEGFGYNLGFDGRFTGNPVADMLFGYAASGFSFDGSLNSNSRRRDQSYFFQDDFRITRTLTINFGVRYDYMSPIYDGYDNTENFIFTPTTATRVIIKTPGYPTGSKYRTFPDRNNWAPRLGLAWNPSRLPRTVIRAGYGVYYVPPEGQFDLILGPKDSPFYYFAGDVSDPTALGFNNPRPIGNLNLGLPSGSAADFNIRTPYVQQWNISVQHELKGNVLVQVGYIGNMGTKLGNIYPINVPKPGPGPIQPRRPYPNYGYLEVNRGTATSAYHGLQVKVEKRYKGGLSLQSSYTWSRAKDSTSFLGFRNYNPFDLRQDLGLADHDVRHRLAAGWTYDLPVGKGKRFMSSGHPVADAVLGGWSLGGITIIESGMPFTPSALGDPANWGAGTRPDVVGEIKISNPTLTRWFNTSAFANPAQYTIGNAGRNIIIGPGSNNWDIIISKVFRIGERHRIQFRSEFFNAFNHPTFNNPGATLGVPSFGVVTSAGPARIIQLGLKYNF